MYNQASRGVMGSNSGVIKIEGPSDSCPRSTWLPTRMHMRKLYFFILFYFFNFFVFVFMSFKIIFFIY